MVKDAALIASAVALLFSTSGDALTMHVENSKDDSHSGESCDAWAPCQDPNQACVLYPNVQRFDNDGPGGSNKGSWICTDKIPQTFTLYTCPNAPTDSCAVTTNADGLP